MSLPVTYPSCSLVPKRDDPQLYDTWVQLFRSPNEYSVGEAKLLCQESARTWVAWVPNYGEMILDKSDFYCRS